MSFRFPFLGRTAPTPAVLAHTTPTLAPVTRPVTTAAPVPAPVVPQEPRATYRVHFDGAIPDLIAHNVTRGELKAAALGHVRPYARASHAVIDAERPFVLVSCDDKTVARATFEVLPTGGSR